TGSASTSYSDAGLAATTTYYYRVSAINAAGTSQPSNTSSATTQTAPPACTGTGTTICLDTNSFNVGQDISVTGVNFTPNSQITLSFDNTAIGVGYQDVGSGSTSPLTVTTDSSGKFIGIMQPLRSVAGKHTVSAQDASKKAASQSVTILPHVYVFPTTAKPGQSILIPPSQGNGFAANSAIKITFDGTAITPSSSITTDSTGNFGGSFTVPTTATTGSHTIIISDSKGDSYTIPSFSVDPNAHSFSAQVVATGLAPACSYWPGCNDVPAYFAFIPDNGPGVDGSGAFMVNEKNSGNVFVFKYSNGQFVQQSVPFVKVPNLQVNFETNGLMGIALDPNWANSTNPEKWVYLYVTRNQTVNGAATDNVIGEVIRYHATTDSSGDIIADTAVGEQVVLGNIPAWNNGHNGGGIKFDPHGNLIISTGDGWLFDEVSQNLASYQGKILRITPVYGSQVGGNWYTIPASNPYASSTNPVTQAIWAYGQRNPYSFDVDSKTGKIYISSTGFNTWEAILNATSPGSNDGWSDYERPAVGNPANLQNYVPPMYWYSHQGVEPQTGPALGLEALSAGAFYHGTTYPGLDGAYIFGDYAVGKIEALLPSSVAAPTPDPLTGVPVSKVVPLLYGLNLAPIYMEEWNGKMYFFDLYGNMYQLNYG
ncbi:MAG: PQQ-dependent sugar dehydrogenase, partial [Thaumarchaeota archaeon]|nr:PQQ-dependent sugar dehydrogenase [Nitrososphaerota archaeon]